MNLLGRSIAGAFAAVGLVATGTGLQIVAKNPAVERAVATATSDVASRLAGNTAAGQIESVRCVLPWSKVTGKPAEDVFTLQPEQPDVVRKAVVEEATVTTGPIPASTRIRTDVTVVEKTDILNAVFNPLNQFWSETRAAQIVRATDTCLGNRVDKVIMDGAGGGYVRGFRGDSIGYVGSKGPDGSRLVVTNSEARFSEPPSGSNVICNTPFHLDRTRQVKTAGQLGIPQPVGASFAQAPVASLDVNLAYSPNVVIPSQVTEKNAADVAQACDFQPTGIVTETSAGDTSFQITSSPNCAPAPPGMTVYPPDAIIPNWSATRTTTYGRRSPKNGPRTPQQRTSPENGPTPRRSRRGQNLQRTGHH